jgi:hypothetical protein
MEQFSCDPTSSRETKVVLTDLGGFDNLWQHFTRFIQKRLKLALLIRFRVIFKRER